MNHQTSSNGLSFLSKFDPSEFYDIAKDLPNTLELSPEIENTSNGDDNIEIITTHLLLPQDSIYKLIQDQASSADTTDQYNIDDLSNMLNHADQNLPATSKLPSADPFLGLFNFQISLAPNTGPVKKTASWTYSKLLNKVYCIPGVSVPVEVSTNDIPPLGTVIRAMAIYAKAEHGQQAITRCENHKKNREFDKDVTDESILPHFVRLRDVHATYMTDPFTERQSVCVPFEKPQPGMNTTTMLIQFMCYSSCVGGTQKPVKTVLTMEYNGEILGRASFEIKICACPGRDRMNDEKKAMPKTKSFVKSEAEKQTKKTEQTAIVEKVVEKVDMVKKSSIHLIPTTSEEEETFILKVKGRKNYEMLKQLNEALELKNTLMALKRNGSMPKLPSGSIIPRSVSINPPAEELDKTVLEEKVIKTEETNSGQAVNSSVSFLTRSITRANNQGVKRKADKLPATLEEFLQSVDMSAYYNLIASKGIINLNDLLGSNKKVLNSFRISKNDTNKLWEAIQALNQKMMSQSSEQVDEVAAARPSDLSKKPKLNSAPTILNDSLRLFSFNDSMNLTDLALGESNYVKLSKCQIRYSFNANNTTQ